MSDFRFSRSTAAVLIAFCALFAFLIWTVRDSFEVRGAIVALLCGALSIAGSALPALVRMGRQP